MKLVMKTLWLFLMKKKNIDNQKKVLEWWTVEKSGVEKISLIEEGKKIGFNEVIKRNEIIKNSLK